MKDKLTKIALLGVGVMGQNHIRNLMTLNLVEVSFIYDIDKNRCDEISKQYGVKASNNLEEDLKNVDGVIVVTPTFTHAKYIEQVCKYVKNIFVEKPLVDTLESNININRLILQKDLNIQVGFIERYNSAIIELKKILSKTKKIVNIDFQRANLTSNRISDVDVVVDLMIHDIDLALQLNGKVKNVQASGLIRDGMIEFARAIISHENGSFSNILASKITPKKIRQISVTCDDVYVQCNLLNKEIVTNNRSLKEEVLKVQANESLLLELKDFISLCRGENKNIPNERDALAAIQVADEIQKQIKKQAR